MDLAGAAKHRFRTGLMHLYASLTGLKFVPRKECIFGLGAQYASEGALKPGSELETFTHLHMTGEEPFITPDQYVSVEGKVKSIYNQNVRLHGPRCIWGDFSKALTEFAASKDTPAIAILNADFMCGIEKALPSIRTAIESLATAQLPEDSKGTLIAINVIGDHLQARMAWKRSFPPVLETLKKEKWFRSLLTGAKNRDRLILVDNFPYDNKPVGKGAGGVKMHTLVFWWGNRRDLSGLRGRVKAELSTATSTPGQQVLSLDGCAMPRCSACRSRQHNARRCEIVKRWDTQHVRFGMLAKSDIQSAYWGRLANMKWAELTPACKRSIADGSR